MAGTADGGLSWWRRVGAGAVAGLHYALVPYTTLAWVWPDPTWLTAHLIFLPAMVAHWPFNRNVCVLNNLESWLRTGQWWNPNDPDQGGWVAGVAERMLGRPLPSGLVCLLPYLLLGASWTLSYLHLRAVSR